MSMTMSRVFVTTSLALVLGTSLIGQQAQPALTADDYARAERFLTAGVTPLVVGGTVAATWLPDDRFWYRNPIPGGAEFIIVDPARKTRARAFDHGKVAAALAAAAGAKVDPLNMAIQALVPSPDGTAVTFTFAKRRWTCAVDGAKCADVGAAPAGEAAPPTGGRGGRGGGRGGAVGPTSTDGKPLNLSPDGKRGVFIRDWNLWVHDVATRQERQLTTDGAKYFGYATDNAGWTSSDRAIALWSPDSKKIATQQQDEREVGEMYFVNTVPGHPTLRVSKYPLPGDTVMAMLHRVVIDVDSGKTVRLQMDLDFHRGTLSDNINVRDYNWSPDGSKLALASVSRDHKQVWLRVADTATGAVRTVLEEKVATHYESRAPWQVLWPSNEVIWYSERTDWGNLYLYDLTTGALKRPITSGEGPVTAIERVDEKARTLWYGANGRENGRDPYFTHYYRVSLDGTPARPVLVTPDDGMHDAQVSPSGRYVIDTSSKPDVPAAVTLRDASGTLVMPLERTDISKLTATGWKPPTRITMKAADGKTDIYGLMFTPTKMEPGKKYPIVNQVYPGPQSGSTGSRAFTAARGDRQALAELGFIVVTIDGRGTPGRSKSFMDAYYGAMGRDNTIPDQIAGMKDLARQYPFIDIDRAGIWGHSGGGFATTSAMFRYPDFFKVGIAESGNHDQRNYEDDWGERYQGLLLKNADGTDNYEIEANQTFAKNLKGKLMLAHGTMDTNVPPSQTLLVVEALIKANKDFDLIMLPNQAHGYAADGPYMMRRRWDYFVKWLMGAEPPREYKMRP
jgi:dipeptidyl aminopeptidase/acylaminoacyl peptidase